MSMSRPCLLLMVILAGLLACASPKAPTGGPEDELPPTIIPEESTPNFQTNFHDKKVTITFDEWFTLKEAATQVVISPLMPDAPEINQKGKSILIELPDSLREETTYTIHFGNAIADLNEGNILENYAFVFSTGSVLDSAKVNGKVMDAATLKPAEGVWVLLHPFGMDSAIYKRKPDYIAKTDKEGNWSMSNIRPDTFSVFTLKDDNLNFLYDQVTEKIGWQEEPVITTDPLLVVPEMTIFDGEKTPVIRDVIHAESGWLKIVIDGPVPKPIPVFSPVLDRYWTAWDLDTLHVWYPPLLNYAGSVILDDDTTRIKQAVNALPKQLPTIAATTGRLHPLANARFKTMIPIDQLDTSRIMVMNDSLEVISAMMSMDSSDHRIIEVKAAWQPNVRHTLFFLPGAITDVWGRSNDTVKQSLVVNAADQFGDITLDVDQLDSTHNYILIIRSGDQTDARYSIREVKNIKLKRQGILPGKYVIELIEDINDNGVWDTGNYNAGRQPERKKQYPLDNVRAAWELDVKILWD